MCWEYGIGSTDIVEVLCSYFFDDPVHLFSIENPRKGEVTDTWTTKEVKGKKIIDVLVHNILNPVTGTNWERTGAQPDVQVQNSEAFERAIELARIQILSFEVGSTVLDMPSEINFLA